MRFKYGMSSSPASRGIAFSVALFVLVAVCVSASALADEPEGIILPTQAEVAEAIDAGGPAGSEVTDPAAAEGVSLRDLQRDEALELLNGVFEAPVEEAAGIYDELQPAKLLSPNVAVLPEDGTAGQSPAEEESEATREAHEAASPAGDRSPGRDKAAEALPEAEARKVDGPPPQQPAELAEASLLDSTVPLEVGAGEILDLSLQRQNGHLEPIAPLVQAEIPNDLGERIELPEVDIGIEVINVDAERMASIGGKSLAFYPNVAEDSDLAVSPTPTGVETLTQLRSPESPDLETYRLSLPAEAELVATEGGGAEVRKDGRALLKVPPPSALDAAGAAVTTELTVSGDRLQIHVNPAQSSSYPILVDPLFQTYEWAANKNARGICSSSTLYEPGGTCSNREEWGYEQSGHYMPPHMQIRTYWEPSYGIVIEANEAQTAGDHATVLYTVPRYFTQTPPPTSFIKSLKLSDVRWEAKGQYSSPYLFMGIWDATAPTWVSYRQESGQNGYGNNNIEFVYSFEDKFSGASVYDQEAKVAEISINATETTANSNARVNVGAATVELGDEGAPKPPQPIPQTQWVNQSAPALGFTAADYGLGVYVVTASTAELNAEGKPLHTWSASAGCSGVGDAACPQVWESSKWTVLTRNAQPLTYDPSVLPSGIDDLYLVAEDPIGNRSSTGLEEVKVDHIAPTLNLTGTMTEQEQLGTRRGSYTLKASASDGNTEHPQSGISKAEVKLDGKAVAMEGKQAEEWSPNCTSRNCPLSAEWTLSTAGLAEGKHTVEVIATDAVGNSTSKSLTIEVHPATAPSLTLSGSMTEQATLGTSRPRYILKAKSSAMTAGFESPTLGAPAAYLGEVGEEREKTSSYEPFDVATDSNGNAWVLDDRNQPTEQLQEFNEKGEWLRTTGGSGYGKLNGPLAVATDSSRNVWVADTSNNRIVEFNEKGEFIETFGTNVNKTKVEAAGTEAEKNLCTAASGNVCQAATAGSLAGQLKSPEGIALTSGGNIWVTDTGNNRIEKFTPSGGLLNNLSGAGSEPGKLSRPMGITVGPDGSIWVADTGNNRIERWSSTLVFMSAVGSEGWENGKFVSPYGIDVDSTGTVWVGDGTGRVQGFDETGTYLQTFGSAAGKSGRAAGGVTVDSKGSIWVASPGMHRAYHWLIPGFPVYSSSVGSSGTGNGQFKHLAGLASDGNKGHIWALDQELGRLQEFNEKGEWLRNAGTAGSGAGMLSSPSGLSANNLGNVWVADSGNNRIVEFNEKGEFVETFGTNVNKTKVEAAGTEAEKNLCTAASGNVCQAATAGSAAGQLKAPQGVAVTSSGNLWVADTGNNRIEKFNPSGSLLNNISGEGTEPGKLKEPAAIAVAPDGSIWVADTGNNRIQAWNSSLTLIHTVGKEGSGGGEFKSPAAIFADASGNIWVGDQKNNRVEEFGEGGRYRGQFGANGSGKFSLSAPMGIAVDNGASIWVADPGHSKIQRWSQETPRSEITTTLWIDGKQQTGLHGVCKTAGCTIEPQWTLESAALEAGSHVARVKTTDGLGRSTESSVNFGISRDTTKPTLEVSGELFNAPRGWVEQESYGFNATATDAGYGVTSITLKIDEKQVASTSQACPEGGCKETLSKQISMASFAGGAHSAEVLATDGAGKTETKRWIINVDPEGHISTKEAEATLEAVEGTTSQTPVAPTKELLEPDQINFGDNPGLQQVGSTISSTGVPDLTTMTTSPATGFTINSPYGQTTITPVVSETASSTQIAEGVAGVSANVGSEVDSVLRPEYNGVETFQAIRSETSPETYSWNVHLYEGQTLQLIDSHNAEVLYASGKVAFLIAAEQAHDATGKEVPTSLAVSGSVLTLTVNFHSGTFVYPVLAGAGWETAYRAPVLIEGPENELEIREREEREKAEQEAREAAPPPPASGHFTEAEAKQIISSRLIGEEIIPAPEPSGGEATASTVPEKVVKPFKQCSKLGGCNSWWVELKNPSYHYGSTLYGYGRAVAYWQDGTQVHGESWFPAYYRPELDVNLCDAGFLEPGVVYAGEHRHLTVWLRALITATAFTYEGDSFTFENHLAMQIWVWPNGYQQRWNGHWEVTQNWVEHGGKCAIVAF